MDIQPESEGSSNERLAQPTSQHSRLKLLGLWAAGIGLGTAGLGTIGVCSYRGGVLPSSRTADVWLATHGFSPSPDGAPLVGIVDDLAQRVETLARKFKASETIYCEELNQALLALDWLEYLRRNSAMPPAPSSEATVSHYEPFLKQVTECYAKARRPGASPREAFEALKTAFDECMQNSCYNVDSNLIHCALIPGSDGQRRLQCDSGTRLFMCVARLTFGVEFPDNKLVYIYSTGHTLPGVMLSDSAVLGAETTAVGGLMDISLKPPPSVPLRVVDSFQDDLLALCGAKISSAESKPTIFDSVPVGLSLSIGTQGRSANRAAPGERRFGFGSAKVPEGDRQRAPAFNLSVDELGGDDGLSARLGAQNPTATREKHRELLALLSPKERQDFDLYLSFTSDMIAFYNRHVPIVNDKSLSPTQKSAQLAKLMTEIDRYWERHDLVQLNDNVMAALERHGLVFSAGSTYPAHLYNIVSHNQRAVLLQDEP